MNISSLIEKHKGKEAAQDESPNYVQPNPNGFVPYPQNNEFLFQSNPNNFPNQFVQSPQGSASFSNNGNGLFQNVGPGPQNGGDMLSQNGMSSPNTFAHQHPQSSGSLSGFNNIGPGLQNNNGNGLLNNAIPGPNSGTLGGLHNLPSGFQNGGAFMSHNALSAPNFIPNQLSQSGANSGSLNNGNGLLNNAIPGPQNSGTLGGLHNLPSGFQNGGAFMSHNALSAPNFIPNQLSQSGANSGSLNNGNELLNNAIPGPQNSAGTLGGLHNLGSGFQNGGAFMSHNALSAPNFIPNQLSPSGASSGSLNGQNFGPALQMGSYSNGIFNGMVPPRGSNSNNIGDPESSLFQMFQQNQFRQNQMGYNQNVGKDRNIQDNCFQKTVDKSYNGISNFNDFTGAKQQDQQMQEILKQQQANQQEQQQGVNQPAQQILQQQQQQQQQQQSDPQGQQKQKENQDVDNFIKSILGQDIFDYAKKELKFDDGKINNNQYPATEESLFKRCTDSKYDGITCTYGNNPVTDKYKSFKIYKRQDEPIESVQKKILQQNEWVKADENKLKTYFRDVKKAEEERKRDEMYGRVKRGVIIDESFDTNEKTTRRTHIYEDIEVGLRDWVNFGRKPASDEDNGTNKTIETSTKNNIRSKREAIHREQYYKPDEHYEDVIEKFAKIKSEDQNTLITNFIDNLKLEPQELQRNNKHLRYKRAAPAYEKYYKPEKENEEVFEHFAKIKSEDQNSLITNFIDNLKQESQELQRNNKHLRYKRAAPAYEKYYKPEEENEEVFEHFAKIKSEDQNSLITNFIDNLKQESQELQRNNKHLRYKRAAPAYEKYYKPEEENEEVFEHFAKIKSEDQNSLITNFIDNLKQESQELQRNNKHLRYKRAAPTYEKYYKPEEENEEVFERFAKIKTEDQNSLITNFIDNLKQEPQELQRNNKHFRYKRAAPAYEKHYKPEEANEEVFEHFAKIKSEDQNSLITNFIDNLKQESQELQRNNKHLRYKRAAPAYEKHYKPEEENEEVFEHFAKIKAEDQNSLITNFIDNLKQENQSKHIRYKRAAPAHEKYYKPEEENEEVFENFAKIKTKDQINLMTNFMDCLEQENPPRKQSVDSIHRNQKNQDIFREKKLMRQKRETSEESEEDLIGRIVAAFGFFVETRNIFRNIRKSMRRRCNLCIKHEGRQYQQFL
ncbi:hypothetical protein M8J77_007148 [Diaphorina citri]|nr:hypothetical protein M8J77_007148 [Diaphorina citri]